MYEYLTMSEPYKSYTQNVRLNLNNIDSISQDRFQLILTLQSCFHTIVNQNRFHFLAMFAHHLTQRVSVAFT